MELKIIDSEKEYLHCLKLVDEMFNRRVTPESPEGEKLKIMLQLIKQYEDQHHPIPKP